MKARYWRSFRIESQLALGIRGSSLPMRSNIRKPLSFLLKPLIGYLFKKDLKSKVSFKEGAITIGLYCSAIKPSLA